MATNVGNGGKIDEQGYSRWLYNALSSGFASTRTATSWKVIQRGAGANMSVDIKQGDGYVDISSAYGYWGWISSADSNAAVTAADPSNPRIDRVVAYVDLATISTAVTNNTGALKFLAVAGTAAGSPAAPNNATVQAAVGAANPYIDLAQLAVAAGATTVVTANITDKRKSVSSILPQAPVITSVAATTILDQSYDVVYADATSGAITVTLPDATLLTGRIFRIIKKDSSVNAITVGRTSSQNINGSANNVVFYQQYQGAEFMSDGTGWILKRWIGTRLLKKAENTANTTTSGTAAVNTLAVVTPPLPVIVKIKAIYMFSGGIGVNDMHYVCNDGTNDIVNVYSHSAAQNQRTVTEGTSEAITNPGSLTFTSNFVAGGSACQLTASAAVPASIEVLLAM